MIVYNFLANGHLLYWIDVFFEPLIHMRTKATEALMALVAIFTNENVIYLIEAI